MPKIKTHKGAKRRFHITGTGRIMRRKGSVGHFRRNKPRRVRSQFDEMHPVVGRARKHIRRLLPYGVP